MEKQLWEYSAERVIERAVERLTAKEKLTRFEIDERFKSHQYPISLPAWDSYKKSISASAETGVSAMKLESLYKICAYTGVSADYMLGLTDTKLKDQSAERVREEFGLSDEAMESLKSYMTVYPILYRDNSQVFTPTELLNYLLIHSFGGFANHASEYIRALSHLNEYMNSDEEPKTWEELSPEARAKLPEDANRSKDYLRGCVRGMIAKRRKTVLEKQYYFFVLIEKMMGGFYREVFKSKRAE